jgi:hypothetical protein
VASGEPVSLSVEAMLCEEEPESLKGAERLNLARQYCFSNLKPNSH